MEKIICDKCQSKNNANRTNCWMCGKELNKNLTNLKNKVEDKKIINLDNEDYSINSEAETQVDKNLNINDNTNGKIYIKRKKSLTGDSSKLICYLDYKEICRIKEDEAFVINIKSGIHYFNCKLTLGNLSETYPIEIRNCNDIICVEESQGFWRPNVTIYKANLTMLQEIEKTENIINFVPTNKIGNYLYIDENKKQWCVPKGVFKAKIENVYSYNDIVSFELIEDGNIVSNGGLGTALVGGALFGGTGAIVGSNIAKRTNKPTCTMMKIKITVRDSSNPLIYIDLLSAEVKKDGSRYKTAFESAQEILSLLQIMCDETSSNKTEKNYNDVRIDVPEEIIKYKKLLDGGIINQEEFDKKKKQLLDL